MKISARKFTSVKRLACFVGLLAVTASITACNHFGVNDRHVERPAEMTFGFGPRTSDKQLYTATLQAREPLRLRKLQTLSVMITDLQGQPVDEASIRIDGGMPEHSHGLPTQPKVSRYLGGGVYEIAGVRFSMGGWWELKLLVDSPRGSDNVVFNLNL